LDARYAPKLHATAHESGGIDEIEFEKLDTLIDAQNLLIDLATDMEVHFRDSTLADILVIYDGWWQSVDLYPLADRIYDWGFAPGYRWRHAYFGGSLYGVDDVGRYRFVFDATTGRIDQSGEEATSAEPFKDSPFHRLIGSIFAFEAPFDVTAYLQHKVPSQVLGENYLGFYVNDVLSLKVFETYVEIVKDLICQRRLKAVEDLVFPPDAVVTPAPVAGSSYFDATTNELYIYNGVSWVSVVLK